MAEFKEGYWSKHHTGLIQCALALYCAVIATLEYFRPRSIPLPNSAGNVGAAMKPAYSMPLYLWIGIVALALSVAIPAIIGFFSKRRKRRNADEKKAKDDAILKDTVKKVERAVYEAKHAGAQARLLWHFEAEARQLERFLVEVGDKWKYVGESLIHPISIEFSDWKNFSSDETFKLTGLLRDFKSLYANHLEYVRLEFPGLDTPLLKLGYPSNAEYHAVMFAIKDHCESLDKSAERIWNTDEPLESIDVKAG